MGLAQLWDLSFTAFEVFVGVGIVWMLFVEPRLPTQDWSFPVMTLLAVVAAVLFWIRGWRNAAKVRAAAQKQIDEATARYEEEVG